MKQRAGILPCDLRRFVGELDSEVPESGLAPAVEEVGTALRLGVEDGVAAALVRQHQVVRAHVVPQMHLVRLARLTAVAFAAHKRRKEDGANREEVQHFGKIRPELELRKGKEILK